MSLFGNPLIPVCFQRHYWHFLVPDNIVDPENRSEELEENVAQRVNT